LKPGIKSSELWVVLIVLVTWALRYLGFEVSIGDVQSGAVEIAKQLHGITASPDNSGIWLAALYTAGRVIIKVKGDSGRGPEEHK